MLCPTCERILKVYCTKEKDSRQPIRHYICDPKKGGCGYTEATKEIPIPKSRMEKSAHA
jgi:hypothetical protein